MTIQELKGLNQKINNIKTTSASLQAEIKVLNEQLDTQLKSLSQQLGTDVTRENLEALYAQMSTQLEEKAQLVQSLLADLENGGTGNVNVNITPQNIGTVPNNQQMQQAQQQFAAGLQSYASNQGQSVLPEPHAPQGALNGGQAQGQAPNVIMQAMMGQQAAQNAQQAQQNLQNAGTDDQLTTPNFMNFGATQFKI